MNYLKALKVPAAAAALALAVSGCTGSAPDSESGNEGDGGVQQIRYLIEQPEDPAAVDLLESNIDTFEKDNPGIKVKLETMPMGNMRTVLQTQLRSGEGPDVFSWGSGPGFGGALAEAGLLYDLSDAYESHDWEIYDFAKERVTTPSGVVFGIPGDIETIGLYYNKEIFEDLGLSQPENLGDLKAASEKIDAAGITPIAVSDKEGWQGGHLLSMALSSRVGSEGMNKLLSGETAWSSPDVVAALDTWNDFNSAGYLPKFPTSLTYDGANALFFSGKAATLPTGSWLVPEIQANTDFEVGYIPFPAPNSDGIFSGGLGSGPMISANSTKTDAAIKFIDYLVSPEHGRWKVENLNMIPPYPIDTEGLDTSPLFAKVVSDASKIADGTGDFGYNIDVLQTDVFNEAMTNGIQAILTDQKTPDQVAEALEAASQQAESQEK